jgi:hypothetical protein
MKHYERELPASSGFGSLAREKKRARPAPRIVAIGIRGLVGFKIVVSYETCSLTWVDRRTGDKKETNTRFCSDR